MEYATLGAVIYPRVEGLRNSRVQKHINTLLKRRVRSLLRRQGFGQPNTYLWGVNETRLNASGVLSITEDIYAYREHAAHGLTMRTAATFDLVSGRLYTLSELFRSGLDYITPISQEIKRQIEEKKIPLLRDFAFIAPNQEYYIAATALVVYFQTYDYTPYYVGIPEFPIPLDSLIDYLDEPSPLHRLIQPTKN